MKAALILLLVTTGCYVHAVEQAESRPIGNPVLGTPIVGSVGTMEVSAENRERRVDVHVVRPRQCTASATQEIEIVTKKRARLGAVDVFSGVGSLGGGPGA